MARLGETMMPVGHIFGNENTAQMTNPAMGGQLGALPSYKAMPSDTPFAPQNIIVQLIEAPLFYNYLPNTADLVAMLKAMLERYPVTVDGFDKTVTYSFIEQDIGGGQKISRVSDAVLPQANISFAYEEKGNARTIANFWRYHGDFGLMDPFLKRSRLSTLEFDDIPIDQLIDMSGFSIIGIEPDAYMARPVVTYMINGMQPKSSGEIKSKRAKVSALEAVAFTVEMTGFLTEASAVDKLGAEILKNIERRGLNPSNNVLFSPEISADVEAATTGYMDQIKEVADNA